MCHAGLDCCPCGLCMTLTTCVSCRGRINLACCQWDRLQGGYTGSGAASSLYNHYDNKADIGSNSKTDVKAHCMMQVRKHKEQAEWAEKKYAELERCDASSSVQHLKLHNNNSAGQPLLAVRAKVFGAVLNRDHQSTVWHRNVHKRLCRCYTDLLLQSPCMMKHIHHHVYGVYIQTAKLFIQCFVT